MKTAAIFLYAIAFLIAAAAGPDGIIYIFPVFALGVTVFFGLIIGFMGLFRAFSDVKQAHVERETHKKWIL